MHGRQGARRTGQSIRSEVEVARLARMIAEDLQVLGILPRDTAHVGDPFSDRLYQGVPQAMLDVAPRRATRAHRRHPVTGQAALKVVPRLC